MDRFRRLTFGLAGLGLATLAACGPLPKPFQPPPDSAPAALTSRDAGSGVRVSLLDGTAAPMAQLLSQSVAADLVARGIPATVTGGEGLRYTLAGTVEELPPEQVAGTVARIHWRLMDRGAQPFFTFSQDVAGTGFDWQYGSPKVIKTVGDAAARLVAEAVEPEDETLKAVQPLAVGVWVQPIRGAPGDGDKSLTRAMRFALMGAKVAVTSERLAARHILHGDVRLSAARDGKQNVEIRWTVRYPDGGQVGNAVQRNQVPEGTFDGRWGETAAIIAAAAVDGIKSVLDRAEDTVRYRVAGEGLKTDVVRGAETPLLPPPNLTPAPERGAPPAGQGSN